MTKYDVHNLFGFLEAKATNKALLNATGKRPFVLSRSTYVSSGRYTSHWTEDKCKMGGFGLLNSSHFELWTIRSSDDWSRYMWILRLGDTNEELCRRWIQKTDKKALNLNTSTRTRPHYVSSFTLALCSGKSNYETSFTKQITRVRIQSGKSSTFGIQWLHQSNTGRDSCLNREFYCNQHVHHHLQSQKTNFYFLTNCCYKLHRACLLN